MSNKLVCSTSCSGAVCVSVFIVTSSSSGLIILLTDTTEYGPWGFAYEAPCVHNHPYGTDVYQKRDVIVRRSCNKCGMNEIISITEEVILKECHGYDW